MPITSSETKARREWSYDRTTQYLREGLPRRAQARSQNGGGSMPSDRR